MKLAFVFPPGLLSGRTLDFTNLLGDKRGTTGSEIVALTFPIEMALREHDVTLFVEKPNASTYGPSVTLREYSTLGSASEFNAVLAVCTGTDFDLFRTIDPKALRVVFMQVNGFEEAKPDFAEFVDLFISPSEDHIKSLSRWLIKPKKWISIPNGCYPNDYTLGQKAPGRCVYLSSPDRGLHHVLQNWAEIKSAVPHAELRIFYFALQRWIDEWAIWNDKDRSRLHPFHQEQFRRSRTVNDLLDQPGVTVVGGASRNQIGKELSEAEILAFPADTISYTESFSCVTLESCAAGALPILMKCDAMASIYEGVCPMAEAKDADGWTRLMIRALTVPPWTDSYRKRARDFALSHAWPLLAERLEKLISERMAIK